MADSKAPPMAFWVVVGLLFGGCCVFSALFAWAAPNAEEWIRRDGFVRGVRSNMDLPDEDEERLARLAYEAFIATGGTREFRVETGLEVAEGARRADDRVLVELHQLRTTLARSSDHFCASLWTGAPTDEEVYPLLARQPDDVVRSFFRVVFQLLDAVSEDRPAVITEEEVVMETDLLMSAAMASRVPSAIALALELDPVGDGSGLDENQACGALLELHDFILAQPEPHRARAARVLISWMSPIE